MKNFEERLKAKMETAAKKKNPMDGLDVKMESCQRHTGGSSPKEVKKTAQERFYPNVL